MQTREVPIQRNGVPATDAVVVEEPLEIRVGEKPVSVTLRTPGDDFDLVAGFLFTESILKSRDDVDSIRHWGSPNIVRVSLRDGARVDLQRLQRHFYSTSSCGVCGKASLDAVRLRTRFSPAGDPVRVDATTLYGLPDALREAQRIFESTGGLHAAGLFTTDGTALVVREDVGRHNAVDKVLGWALLQGRLPASGCVLMVSGRASFELVQKAVMAGVPVLAAVSAPSSLAVELAVESGMTLVGFLRGTTMNVYAGPDRIVDATANSSEDQRILRPVSAHE